MSDESKGKITKYLGPDFQQKLIWQLLVEPEFAKNVLPNVAVEYFDDHYLKRFFLVMSQYYEDHDKVPNLQNGSIDDAIYKYSSTQKESDKEVLKGVLDRIKLWNERVINKNQLYDGDVVRNDTINFIKQQEYRKLGEYIISKTKTGEIRSSSFNLEVEEKINKIYHIGDEDDYGTDVIEDIDSALSGEFRETIPTGIEVIDAVTGNGLGKGEIGLILAPSGIGKTTILSKIANSGFKAGKKVLQIIFEDTIKQVQRKHYAIWSGVKLSEIDENRDLVKKRSLEHYKQVKERGGKIDIVRFSQEDTTIYEIRNWISRQEKKFGYKYDEIVLDYLDCLEPNKKERELLSAELSIIKSFEAMAADYNIPCWSAIQTNRTGFDVEFVEAHNTGGNIKRVQKSHFVMSIAKPDKSESNILANIKILKARFAEDGHEFKGCIFNNDSLEIRITDKKYLNGLKTKKYDDDDLSKIDKKAENLNSGYQHDKISEVGFDHSPTISDLSLNESTQKKLNSDNNSEDFHPEKEFHDKETKEADISQSGTTNNTISESKVSEDSDDINPEDFFTQCGGNDDNVSNNQLDFLKKKRDEQGDIINDEKK